MTDPDLTWCLNRVKDAYFHLLRAGDSLVEIGNVEEGKHYLAEASKYIGKTKDMLNRYREFIKEDCDEEGLCGTGNDDAERNADGMLG